MGFLKRLFKKEKTFTVNEVLNMFQAYQTQKAQEILKNREVITPLDFYGLIINNNLKTYKEIDDFFRNYVSEKITRQGKENLLVIESFTEKIKEQHKNQIL